MSIARKVGRTHSEGRISRQRALAICEEIASRDRSNLFQVSQYLQDRQRYEAFLAMYAVMRVIDDRVDGIAGGNSNVGRPDQKRFEKELAGWRERIEAAFQGRPRQEPLDVALSGAAAIFPVPLRLWWEFLEAMAWDLRHDRFETPEDFLRYARGATGSPTTIFVYLLTAERECSGGDARYVVRDRGDGFDYLACGHGLGLFAYIAHILRDVVPDLQLGPRGRIYIPLSDLFEAGLTEAEFRELVIAGRGDSRWGRLVESLVQRGRIYEESGVQQASLRLNAMEADCRFVLTLIILLYQDLLERIAARPEAPLRGTPIQTETDKIELFRRAASGFHVSELPFSGPRP